MAIGDIPIAQYPVFGASTNYQPAMMGADPLFVQARKNIEARIAAGMATTPEAQKLALFGYNAQGKPIVKPQGFNQMEGFGERVFQTEGRPQPPSKLNPNAVNMRKVIPPNPQTLMMGPNGPVPYTPNVAGNTGPVTTSGLGGQAASATIAPSPTPTPTTLPETVPFTPDPNIMGNVGRGSMLPSWATKEVGSGMKGKILGSLAPTLGGHAAQQWLNSSVNPGAARDVANSTLGGIQALGIAGPSAGVAGGIGIGGADAFSRTDLGNDVINRMRGQDVGDGSEADNVAADVLGSVFGITAPLGKLAESTGLISGPTSDTVSDVLSQAPLIGGMFGEQTPEAPAPVLDATINNTNVQDRFNRLMDITGIQGADREQLAKTYEVLTKAGGATDQEAWQAIQEAAIENFQTQSQRKMALENQAAMQMQAQKYMQPHAENTRLMGELQGAALSQMSAFLPANIQPFGQYAAAAAPLNAQRTADAYMMQAAAMPNQITQDQIAKQQQAQQNQIEQMQFMANLKAQGGVQPTNAQGVL